MKQEELGAAARKAAQIESISGRGWAEHYFIRGAKWHEQQGYLYMEEDMRAAFDAGCEYAVKRIKNEQSPHFGEWLKESEAK